MNETTLSNLGVAELLVKLRGEEELTPAEETQTGAYANRLTNQWLSAEVAFKLGMIQPDYFAAICADVDRTLSDRPRLRPRFEEIVVHYPVMETMRIFAPFFQQKEA